MVKKFVCNYLTGEGIDYMHPDFRNADGRTRILAIWDQTIAGTPPAGYHLGTEFTRAVIDEALLQPSMDEAYAVCPSRDLSGHGTHVAGIAAGNGRASAGIKRGVAYGSELLVVKLGTPRTESFPRTTELMQAVDYVVRKARELERPLALNLSFGNNYGSHDGTSHAETYLSAAANYWKSVFLIGTGNEGASRGHASGYLNPLQPEVVEFAVGMYETGLSIQIWKSYADSFAISIVHPNGNTVETIQQIQGTQRFTMESTQLLIYFGEPSPYSPYQEIYIDFIAGEDYVDGGIWKVILVPERIVTGRYDMWMPSIAVLNESTGFLYPAEETTLTIPATADKAIAVAAYDSYYDQPAPFSGRGYTRDNRQIKPDICAPGVNIESCAPGGGYTVKSGTSMAVPFVTGSASLMMEWGIVNGKDPFLYGEKVKAYFIRGARHLPGLTEWPNPQLGWGALCLRNSFPNELFFRGCFYNGDRGVSFLCLRNNGGNQPFKIMSRIGCTGYNIYFGVFLTIHQLLDVFTGVFIGIGVLYGIHIPHIFVVPCLDESARVFGVEFCGDDFIIFDKNTYIFFPTMRKIRHLSRIIAVFHSVFQGTAGQKHKEYQCQ